ncbi:hypothetical protein M569_08094, partial [Genlisea aurea]
RKLKLQIKFAGRSIPVEVPDESSVKDLKCVLHPLTDVLPRGQKLISKGRVLSDELTLASSKLTDGDKVMLIASMGLHQGEAPMKREFPLPISRTTAVSTRGKSEKAVDSAARKRWEATGIIALSDSGLKSIPEEVWSCRDHARVLDLCQNMLHEVPIKISSLHALKKLLLSGNELSIESISWDGLASLKFLTVLQLNRNNLMGLPPTLGTLTSLKQLDISSNNLTNIPNELGFLVELQVLRAQKNRLECVPASIRGCISLVLLLFLRQVDLSYNLLAELPDTFGNLRQLKALYLANNGLKSLPATFFETCSQLSILDLHNTQITADLLRQLAGWERFDERRRLKHQKQLDFRITGSGDFDEGADKN